jgi:hypothetical protein
MPALQPSGVIPAKAGTHEHRFDGKGDAPCSWIPAYAGMTLRVGTAALALAACQRAQAPANEAAPAPKQAAPEGDVSAAERLVRQRIGSAGEIRFSGAARSAADGVPIVCGSYEQGGTRHRYIVVGREEAFIEPQMRAGEMERAVAEFCREENGNAPARQRPPAGEKG